MPEEIQVSVGIAQTMISLCLGMALFSGATVAAAQEIAASAEAQTPAEVNPAEEGKLPIQYVRRPLTLPAMTLAPEVGFSVLKLPDFGRFSTDPLIGVSLGASFGITDDLEVGVTPLPLLVSPEFEYRNPNVNATYRFLPGEFEIGARVRFFIPAQDETDPVLQMGVPMLLHLSDSFRLDTGVNFSFVFGDEATVGLLGYSDVLSIEPGVPLRATLQVTDPVFVQAGTGFGIVTFDDAGESFFMPLGVGAGYTIAGEDAPIADITARFDFPLFLTPGSSGDAVHGDIYYLGLSGKGYFSL